jgi:uncharacterized protein YegP (UPF0339 family)
MKFIIYKSDDGGYYYTIVSRNGQCMLVSETMVKKQSVTNAVKKIMSSAASGSIDDRSV